MELLGIAERQAKSMVEKREKSTAKTIAKTKKSVDNLDGALALLEVDKSKTFSEEIIDLNNCMKFLDNMILQMTAIQNGIKKSDIV